MSQDDFMQIKVEKGAVGIMGLKQVMEEMAKDYGQKPDEEVQAELLNRLCKRNYIPDRVKDNYAKAFLREFKKFLGKPYEKEVSEELEIKVLGQGCARCDELERQLMEVMAEMNLAGDLEHVRDIKEIGKYGVMGTPALIINGKVMSVGSVPLKNKLIEWLTAS
jgi:hypothetical protein